MNIDYRRSSLTYNVVVKVVEFLKMCTMHTSQKVMRKVNML